MNSPVASLCYGVIQDVEFHSGIRHLLYIKPQLSIIDEW